MRLNRLLWKTYLHYLLSSKPEMEKAEAEEHKKATLTEVVEIASPNSQYTEVAAAENAEEPA